MYRKDMDRLKMPRVGWRYGSSGRVPALQVQSPEFKTHLHSTKTKTKTKTVGTFKELEASKSYSHVHKV
jgi:hypothetical protein